jgi:hypothetical protein
MEAHRHGDDVTHLLSLIRKRNFVKNAGELCPYYVSRMEGFPQFWLVTHPVFHALLKTVEGPEKSSIQIVL